MNPQDGFATANIDVGIAHDPKVLALARRLKDPLQTAAHLALYLTLVFETWSRGDRATLEEACPGWWTDELEPVAANLRVVGLIDEETRLPEHAFEAWYRPAWERRQKRKDSGAEGGRRSWDKRRRSNDEATLNPTVLPTGLPVLQTGNADVTRERAGEDARRCATCGRSDATVHHSRSDGRLYCSEHKAKAS
jgi:hypothetical protein